MQARGPKFFLIAPRLTRLTAEAKEIAGLLPGTSGHRSNLFPAATRREDYAIQRLILKINYTFINPLSMGGNNHLYNLVTKRVMADKIKKDLVHKSEIGRKLLKSFVDGRIKSGKINPWATIKKRKLNTWKTAAKW